MGVSATGVACNYELRLTLSPAMATTGDEQESPYEILGLNSEANDAEIRTAYRQRSLKVHPDRVGILFSEYFSLLSVLYRIVGIPTQVSCPAPGDRRSRTIHHHS